MHYLLFRLAPYLAFCASFVAFLALPFSKGIVGYELNVAAFFMLAILSSEVFGDSAGYASASKWSLFGGIREAAQVVSYEVPRSMCVLVPICLGQEPSDLNAIGNLQVGFFWNWYLFHDPFTFGGVLHLFHLRHCELQASLSIWRKRNRNWLPVFTPNTAACAVILFHGRIRKYVCRQRCGDDPFLGGWHTGLLPYEASEQFGWAGHLLNMAIFVGKCWFLVFVMMWVARSLPRLRIDQVMMTCLKYFLPISCILLIGVCLWQLLVLELGWNGVEIRVVAWFDRVCPRSAVLSLHQPLDNAAENCPERSPGWKHP